MPILSLAYIKSIVHFQDDRNTVKTIYELEGIFENCDASKLCTSELAKILEFLSSLHIRENILEELVKNITCTRYVICWIIYDAVERIKNGDHHEDFALLEKIAHKEDELILKNIWSELNSKEFHGHCKQKIEFVFHAVSDNEHTPKEIFVDMLQMDGETRDNAILTLENLGFEFII